MDAQSTPTRKKTILTAKLGVLNKNPVKKLAASRATPKSMTFFLPSLLETTPTGINDTSAPTEATIRAPAKSPPSIPHISVAYFENAVVTALYAIYHKATERSRKIRLFFTGPGSFAFPDPGWLPALFPDRKTYDKAVADGWVPGETLFGIEEACEKGTIIMCLLSDAAVMSVWPTIKPYLTAGKALYFSHGFAITWSDRTGVVPPADIDVIMVAPKGSGTSLRTMFLEGRGLNSSYAIYQDATGNAMDRTIALGIGIGSGYLFETTFIREATSDLTGERGSLMGAIQGLLLAQYEVLRENGHTPSEAFNETVEELTQSLMPLFAKNGMDWMYANCSTTAQRGALDWMGPFHDAIKPVVEKLYHSVKTGNEAQISIDSNSKPDYREKLEEELKALRESEMWQTAVTVRKLRPENN